jgi:DNA-binding transcriptional ArsR family regulator
VPKRNLEHSQIFHALADSTRRAVIERLCQGEATVSELAAPFKMALPSFVQHLGVLEKSGLVCSSKTGRVRTYRLESAVIKEVETWLGTQRNIWETRLEQLEDYLLELKNKSKTEHESQPPELTIKNQGEKP